MYSADVDASRCRALKYNWLLEGFQRQYGGLVVDDGTTGCPPKCPEATSLVIPCMARKRHHTAHCSWTARRVVANVRGWPLVPPVERCTITREASSAV